MCGTRPLARRSRFYIKLIIAQMKQYLATCSLVALAAAAVFGLHDAQASPVLQASFEPAGGGAVAPTQAQISCFGFQPVRGSDRVLFDSGTTFTVPAGRTLIVRGAAHRNGGSVTIGGGVVPVLLEYRIGDGTNSAAASHVWGDLEIPIPSGQIASVSTTSGTAQAWGYLVNN